ncbi:hypothetical protein ACKWTF_010758 [Chironomus riparius]
MEKKTDATADMVDDLQTKTKEFLQPNPAARAKMVAIKLSSGSQAQKAQYPQTEGILGNAMTSHGKKLGEDDPLGSALMETGESLKQIADVKYSLDNNVKQNFLEPLQHLQNSDIKEVLHHRKKLSNRRLDYDGKRRKQLKGGISDDEVRMAQDKFRESLHNASTSMHHLLENDVELISQLAVFSESLMTYYQQCAEIMQELTSKLYEKKSEAMNRPKKQFIPTTLSDLNIDSLSIGSNNDRQNNNSNGARLNNFDRFKATSSSNLSYKHSNLNNNNINNNNNNFSRASKLYGSQSNISSTSSGLRYQTVNNSNNNNNNNSQYYNINSPKTSAGDSDKWLQAWEDNNNNYRAPSFHPNKQTFEKVNLSRQISRTSSSTYSRSNSINNRNSNHRHSNQSADPFDPFDDPWSVKPTISNPILLSQPQPTVNLINNFNNNMRTQQSSAYPHCVALYDFDAENPGELSFKENDTLRLLSRVDDNWYEGMLSSGRTGYIPMSYVQVKIPLP